MTKTYIAEIKKPLFYLIGAVTLSLILTVIVGGLIGLGVFLVLNLLSLIYQLRTFRPKKLVFEFNNKSITLTNTNLLGSESQDLYKASDLYFTYRKRTVSRFQGYRDVCIIDNKIKTIVVLTPDQNGWTDEEIRKIASDLIKIGTKRITEKYSDIEVTIVEPSD